MDFEWDDGKNRINVAKHGVDFETASRIFEGYTLDRLDNRFAYGESREISIGAVGGIVILTVAHTDRNGVCRIISARKADRGEKRQYENQIRKALNP